MPLILLVVLAASVRDATALRSGCSSDDGPLITIPAGAPITIRYAISGESTPCYKVTVALDGKTTEGYLGASQIEGLEEFDQARRQAARVDIGQVMRAVRSSAPALSAAKGPVADAAQWIETGQPARALEILEGELRKRKDPALLALAGVAAWRADDARRALEYWRGSVELHPNSELEALIRRVERESKADQSGDRLAGMRVILRYDGVAVKTETAREMVATLDDAFLRISQQLGCPAEEKVVAIVQTQAAYRAGTSAAEWSGGQFDGRIHIPVLSGQSMDDTMRRVFTHETVHACLAMLGRWPVWMHEGLAQRLSGETLTTAQRQRIAEMIRDHKLPRLEQLGQDWSRLNSAQAAAAYTLALAAAEMIADPGNLVRSPERLAAVTADLDRRLGY